MSAPAQRREIDLHRRVCVIRPDTIDIRPARSAAVVPLIGFLLGVFAFVAVLFWLERLPFALALLLMGAAIVLVPLSGMGFVYSVYGANVVIDRRKGTAVWQQGLLGMGVGRIGDFINGEHIAKVSDLPWAVTYSHPNSPSFARAPQHPAVAYEMIGDLVILGILAFLWRRQPKTGVIFASAFLLYSVMRFFVSFLRIDSKEPLLGLTTPELTAVIVGPLAALVLLFFLLRREPEYDPEQAVAPRSKTQLSRAERRRRLRSGS